MVLAGLLLFCANALSRHLGQTGIRAVSKIVSVILAAFAVMMVRKGILGIIACYLSSGS